MIEPTILAVNVMSFSNRLRRALARMESRGGLKKLKNISGELRLNTRASIAEILRKSSTSCLRCGSAGEAVS